MAIAAVLMVLSAPQADARFGCKNYEGGLRYQQVKVFFGQPFYGRRICGGVYYGGCWRWQYTWWGCNYPGLWGRLRLSTRLPLAKSSERPPLRLSAHEFAAKICMEDSSRFGIQPAKHPGHLGRVDG